MFWRSFWLLQKLCSEIQKITKFMKIFENFDAFAKFWSIFREFQWFYNLGNRASIKSTRCSGHKTNFSKIQTIYLKSSKIKNILWFQTSTQKIIKTIQISHFFGQFSWLEKFQKQLETSTMLCILEVEIGSSLKTRVLGDNFGCFKNVSKTFKKDMKFRKTTRFHQKSNI